MTEETNDRYRDEIDMSEAPKFVNATYYGPLGPKTGRPWVTIAEDNGTSEPLYGKEGRAWRDERWIQRQEIDESFDREGTRERWFFLPKHRLRRDENIMIVYFGNLQFS